MGATGVATSAHGGRRLKRWPFVDSYRGGRVPHRIQGPSLTAAVELDYSQARYGDRAGRASLRDTSAWVGIKPDSGTIRPGSGRRGVFSCSTNGTTFTQIGILMPNNDWPSFMANRHASSTTPPAASAVP
jgi:hypothetical protein